ncbi:MAG: hypothetical protein IKN54_07400, partial [Lachnospiraceae bacterium]|nr:hypothetical protein [Lachnospiraceae bacterium]
MSRINNKQNRKKIKISGSRFRRSCVSLLLVVALVLNTLPGSLLEGKINWNFNLDFVKAANKDDLPTGTVFTNEDNYVRNELYDSQTGEYSISNVEDILKFSRAYYSYPDYYDDAVLDINFSSGDTTSEIEEYLPIGSENNPFKGVIKLTTSSDNFFKIPEAFFDYVADSVQIVDENGEETPLILQRSDENTGEAVFAKHVVHDTEYSGEVRKWAVEIDSLNGVSNYNSSGIIGEMGRNSTVELNIYDNTSMIIYGVGTDVGYVCGKMNKGSSLVVNSITSTNTNYSISTTNGNAGGVVGYMDEGASIIIKCQMPNNAATVTSNGANKYAGGIVGYNAGGTVVLSGFSSTSKYIIKNTLVGQAGAGGLAGYYKPSFDENNETQIDLAHFSIGTGDSDADRVKVNGAGSVGGVFGVLVNEIKTEEDGNTSYSSGNITITDSTDNSSIVYSLHSEQDSTNIAGLVGKYTACELTSALLIKDVSADVRRSSGSYARYGGAIAELQGGMTNSDNAMYVKFDDFVATVKGNNLAEMCYGGAIANAANSFIDVKNVSITSLDSFVGGGVIGRIEDGVLRLIDTTTLSGKAATPANDDCYKTGQIVGYRDNTIIFGQYYKDSDNDSNSRQWKLNRGTSVSVDDIGTWGEVLRFDGLSESIADGVTYTSHKYGDGVVLKVNEKEHSVVVAAPENQTTINSVADYSMIGLGLQLDESENPYLAFDDDWTYIGNTLRNANLTLGRNISLVNTGLIGLTRDNVTASGASTEKCTYCGLFDGNNKTITLAIGEAYGYRSSNKLNNNNNNHGNGKLYRHAYVGLFGIYDKTVGSGSKSVKDVTFAGNIEISSLYGTVYCGSFAGCVKKDLVADNVSTEGLTVTHSGDHVIELGGLVGEAMSSVNSISVSNSYFMSDIIPGFQTGNNNTSSSMGGVIGQISHNVDEERNWLFNSITIGGSIRNNTMNAGKLIDQQRMAGLIADISGGYNDNANHRVVTLDGVSVEGLNISGNPAESIGGMLGYSWNKVDVTADDVVIKDGTGNIKSTIDIGTTSANVAGLVYRATGHWTVTDIDIQNIKINASNAESTGMIVNKGYSNNDNADTFYTAKNSAAIYLELPDNYSYNLSIDGE